MFYHICIVFSIFGFSVKIQILAVHQISNFALCKNCMYHYRMKHKIIFFKIKVNP